MQARDEDQDDAADANDGGMVLPSLKRHKTEQSSSIISDSAKAKASDAPVESAKANAAEEFHQHEDPGPDSRSTAALGGNPSASLEDPRSVGAVLGSVSR